MSTLRTLFCLLALAGCTGSTSQAAPEPASPDTPAPAAEPAALTAASIEVPEFTISTAPEDVARGQELFGEKGCAACHKVGGGKLVGPDLKGVMARRDERWIKKMILRPDVMIKDDELAKKMFIEHLTPMPNQGVDPAKELPLLLAYLKSTE